KSHTNMDGRVSGQASSPPCAATSLLTGSSLPLMVRSHSISPSIHSHPTAPHSFPLPTLSHFHHSSSFHVLLTAEKFDTAKVCQQQQKKYPVYSPLTIILVPPSASSIAPLFLE